MTDVIQRAFNAGEVSEDYWLRNDLEWFNRSLRVCKNFIPTAAGTLVNRQGLKYFGNIVFKPKTFSAFVDNNYGKWLFAAGDRVTGGTGWHSMCVQVAPNGTQIGSLMQSSLQGGSFRDFVSCPLVGQPYLSGVATVAGSIDGIYFGTAPYNVYSDGSTITNTALKHSSYNLIAPSPSTAIPGAALIPVYYQVSTVDVNGAESLPSYTTTDTGDTLSAANQAVISWNEPAYNGYAVSKYYIYRVESKIARFVGDTVATATGSAKTFTDFKFDRDVNLSPVATILEPSSSLFVNINTVCLHQQRLIGAKNRTYMASRVGNPQSLFYNNPIAETNAFSAAIYGMQEILWTRSVGGSLMFFDPQGVWVANPGANGALTPASAGATLRWAQPVKDVAPLLFKNNVAFASNNYEIISLFKNPNGADAFTSKNLSNLTYRFLPNETIWHMGYSSIEHQLLWVCSTDAAVERGWRSCTVDEDQGIIAWARHDTFGGTVVAVYGNYFIIDRGLMSGATKLYNIEYMEPRKDNRINGVYLDSYKSFISGGTNILVGLDHLEGKQVYAMLDGIKEGPYLVTGGTITVSTAASTIHVGLPYESSLTTHDLDLVGNQTLVRQPKITSAAAIWFKNTANGQVRVNADPWQEIKFREEADGYGTVPLQSGLTEDVHMSTSYRREQTLSIRQTEPLPMTITAIARSVRT